MKFLKDKQTRHDFVTYAMCLVAFAIVFFMQSNHMIPRMIAGQLVPITAYIVMAISLNLVVGIVQVTRRDRLVAVRLGELRERVQGLAAGLRCRRGCLLSHAPQHEIARQPRQSPGEHVAHIEVGFDRAAPEQHLEIAGVGVRAGGQCRLQPGRRVIGGERRLKCSC